MTMLQWVCGQHKLDLVLCVCVFIFFHFFHFSLKEVKRDGVDGLDMTGKWMWSGHIIWNLQIINRKYYIQKRKEKNRMLFGRIRLRTERSLDANMWSVDSGAKVTVGSPVCCRCQEYGLSAGESCNLSVEWQKGAICVTNNKSIEKWLNKAATFLKY